MINEITRIAEKALASPDRAFHAIQWYNYAGIFCAELDRDNGLEKGTAAGFVAALSPLNSWDAQLKFTPPSIDGGLRLLKRGQRPHAAIKGPGFFSNKDKAARILQREAPLNVLGGDKVRAFYRNLTGDENAVTIDRHALAIAGVLLPDSYNGKIPAKLYSIISFAFKAAGKNVGLKPCEVQALTWEYWRVTKNGGSWS